MAEPCIHLQIAIKVLRQLGIRIACYDALLGCRECNSVEGYQFES